MEVENENVILTNRSKKELYVLHIFTSLCETASFLISFLYLLFAGVHEHLAVPGSEEHLGELLDDFRVIVGTAKNIYIGGLRGRGKMATDTGRLDELEHRKPFQVRAGGAKALDQAGAISLHLNKLAKLDNIIFYRFRIVDLTVTAVNIKAHFQAPYLFARGVSIVHGRIGCVSDL